MIFIFLTKEDSYPAALFLRDILDSSLELSNGYYNTNAADSLSSDLKEFDYDPTWLDDPNIKSGKHRTVMNLPCFMGTVIGWVKEKELRKELNQQFRIKHEWLHPSLTLSKIRKIKQLMIAVLKENTLEVSTVALACIYFEKLILKVLNSFALFLLRSWWIK